MGKIAGVSVVLRSNVDGSDPFVLIGQVTCTVLIVLWEKY